MHAQSLVGSATQAQGRSTCIACTHPRALPAAKDPNPQSTLVVDSSSAEWLAGWAERQASLAAPHVRTPVMQHPHAQPLALKAFAEKQGRLQASIGAGWTLVGQP